MLSINYKMIFFTVVFVFMNSFNYVSAALSSNPSEESQETKSPLHYSNNIPELIQDIEKYLTLLKTPEDKRIQVVKMVKISAFYYTHAHPLSEILSPAEKETRLSYAARLKSKGHKNKIETILSTAPYISTLTLVKPEELKKRYTNSTPIQMMTHLRDTFKTPFELVIEAYTQSKNKDITTLENFFNDAFIEGCIAKRTTKLSNWMSKNLLPLS